MEPTSLAVLQGAAGAKKESTYVDDVFSTFLYTGDGALETVNNGIDLSTEGGLVVLKNRDVSSNWAWTDTERGAHQTLRSNGSDANSDDTNYGVAFTSTGFTAGKAGMDISTFNQSTKDFCSWTFRKCPGFFDVVTYTGNGTAGRQIAHSLGSTPGMVIVKRTSATEDWTCYHRSLWTSKVIDLNQSAAAHTSGDVFNTTAPTSTVFTVGSSNRVNGNGSTYVAYIFAHDDASFGTNGDESIIKCGSYNGTSSAGNLVDLGFEPQFVIVKRTDSGNNWVIHDAMRGAPEELFVDNQNQEVAESGFTITSTGFTLNDASGQFNASGGTYIYIAIRRPHKPPEAGTEVFDVQTSSDDGGSGTLTSTSVTADVTITGVRSSGWDKWVVTRLLGNTQLLRTNGNNAAASYSHWSLDKQYGFRHTSFFASNAVVDYTFRRAPGFFDVVAYSGTGSARTINHNLGAVPQMIWVKRRTGGGESWSVYSATSGATKNQWVNDNGQASTNDRWNNTSPTSSVFSVKTDTSVNASGQTYVAYLFGNVSGVSKVGSYTGTGNAIDVNCGFASGARFVLIKRTDANGDWYFWDTARGIVSGNDPYLLLNSSAAEVTNTDYIDPLNAGFTVTSSAPAALNANSGTYLFLAIA